MVPLPYEVLTMVILLAAQEDQKTAVQLASVCWDFANVMIPIVYRAVIYREEEIVTFYDPIPGAPPRPKPPAKPRLKTLLKYGHHVRRLHLRVEYDSTARAILHRCFNVKDLYFSYRKSIQSIEVAAGQITNNTQYKFFPEAFMQNASLRKFSAEFVECLPDGYPRSSAFSSLTHFSWSPWLGGVHWSMPNLTHIAVESSITVETAAKILRECKRLKVLAVHPCYTGKNALAVVQDDWQSRVGGDKRLVTVGRPLGDPDGIMPSYGFWEMGSTLVKEGWSLEKAWWGNDLGE